MWQENVLGRVSAMRLFGRERLPDADARLGDTVPHIQQTAIKIYCNGQEMDLKIKPGRWRRAYKNAERSVEGKRYTQGYASGDGCNRLIDTLCQTLNIFSNVDPVRRELDEKYVSGLVNFEQAIILNYNTIGKTF
eukprot:12416595-Karenia_brevis.AAC.1